MQGKYKRLINDMGIFALGAFGSKLILFLLLPIYTHVLTDEQYGIADLVFTVGDLILPIISLAIYNGLLRYGLIKGQCENALLCATIVFAFGSILSIALTSIFGLYRPIHDWRWYLTATILAHFARLNTLIYLKVKGKNKLYSILSIAQALILVFCNIVFLIVIKLGIHGYLLSTIISNVVVAIIALIKGGVIPDLKGSKLDQPLIKEMILYSVPFIFNDISWWIIHSSDKIMIEWMISSSILGIYTAASKIPSLINVVTSIFSQAWGLASIKEFDSTNDSKFYSNVFLYSSIVVFGVCIVIVSITKPFMNIYVGKAFSDSWHYVPLLLISAAFSAISTFATGLYGALKQSKTIMTTAIIAGLANIVINYFLIPILGVFGAVIGTISAYFILALLRVLGLRRKISMDFHLKKIGSIAFVATVQAGFVGVDYHIYVVSFVAIILFLIIIRNDIRPIIGFIKSKARK